MMPSLTSELSCRPHHTSCLQMCQRERNTGHGVVHLLGNWTSHDRDVGQSIFVAVITQRPTGFQSSLKQKKKKAPPRLSHHLTDGRARSLPTSSLCNECMSPPVWGNKITTCFVFSWPGLMLASTAQRLFISSCAVAIYPAASADNSTISHQQ